MSRLLKLSAIFIIVISSFFAVWFAVHGDIIFHTDIARDFLLVEDVIRNKPITLIGPRSGGIPGVFHGPLWTYLNVPAFIIGGGNPAVVGWFWVLLYIVNLVTVYKIGKAVFDREVGWLTAALTAMATAFAVSSMFNPFGAVILSPVFFYFFYKYIKTKNIKDLLISLFVLGLVIQFQMAFGVPILILVIPLLIFLVVKNKKFLHLGALFILLIPLSTFILFDLKHQFLQTRSVLNYVTGKENSGKVDKKTSDVFRERVNSIQTDGVSFFTGNNRWLFYLLSVFYLAALYKTIKDKKHKDKRSFFLLFLYFYLGYWLITVLYKGFMWGYYYWPFLPLIALVFSSTIKFFDKRIFFAGFLVLVIFNFNAEIRAYFKNASYFGHDGGSWRFYQTMAKQAFTDAPAEFGYYVFTADQYGYSARYAMDYEQTLFKDKKAASYEKKPVTYLFIFPSNNPTISDDWWKAEKVKIKSSPVKIFRYKDNMRVEKYELAAEEVADKSDDTLIHTLIFR